MSFPLRAHTHLLTIAGSRAYGMHTAASDVDLKGMAIPPAAIVLGFTTDFAQADSPDEMEVFRADLTADEQQAAARTKLEGSVFALRKLVRLAADCNPHVLDVLFCRDEEVRLQTAIGAELRDLAPAFLSRRARFSFGGYAMSQLKRIETHRRWLLEPPAGPPSRTEFGLPEMPVVSKDDRAAAEAAISKQLERWTPDFSQVVPSVALELTQEWERVLTEMSLAAEGRYQAAARAIGLSDDLVGWMTRERAFKSATQHYRQYRTWQKRRNPARAALEARHGYDTKHAAHLVRLLTMALEIVETQQVHVWRGDRDADRLLAIRAGAWSYDDLMAWTAETTARLDEAMRTTALPEHPDRSLLDRRVIAWMRRTLTECATL